MSSDRLSVCLLCIRARAFASGCSDSEVEYQTPSDAEAKGSSHPALEEKVAAAPKVNPHGGNPHAGIGRANPRAGGGSPGGFGGNGKEIPSDWKAGDPITMKLPGQQPITFTPDPEWKRERPRNRMREAQFLFPHTDNDQHDGEMWVSSAFGDFESNVSRWRGKFKEFPSPAVSDFSQGDIEIKLVEFEGTYNWSARMGAPVEAREGYGMVVAIVRQNIFFVVIGPKETMAKWRPSFDNMLKSVTLAK